MIFNIPVQQKINKIIELNGNLAAGSTTLILSDENITINSTIDIYTNVYGISPKNVTVEDGQITLEFKALDNDLKIKVVVK